MSNTDVIAHDPELGILRELEVEFERELALIAPARPRVRWRDRVTVRVTRRALVLVGLVCLVGGSALAGRSVLAGSPQTNSPPTLLASGGRGLESWQFETYEYRGASCYVLFADSTATSRCQAAPGKSDIDAVSASDSSERFVVGLAGAGVATVLIEVGKHRVLTRTHVPRTKMSGTKLGSELRWFVAIVPGKASAATSPPASITPRASDGRPLGPQLLDCSLGGASQACLNAARRVAAVGPPAHN
ncbi:MAG TPA: hypothetical protein VNU24_07765 [Solirubrobacteraceae bacterium]|nr:hypothetical protein [Solirubrobacteraceae bacterium]